MSVVYPEFLRIFHAPFPWSGSTSSSSPLGGESSMDDLPGSALVDMLILLNVQNKKQEGEDKLTGLGGTAEMRDRHDCVRKRIIRGNS